MVSAIDATKPADGVLPAKADFRANLQAAKNEIEALQAEVVALLGALQLTSGQALFPVIAGNNLPNVAANLTTILQSLNAQIDVAKASGGGASTLAGITDLTSPNEAARRAFQKPVAVAAVAANFNFDENTHGGAFIPINAAANSVTMTLPATSALTRPDGYLCTLSPTSVTNFAAITGPADSLRIQNGFFNITETQTTVFVGLGRASGLNGVAHVYKFGATYIIVGQARITETSDLSFGAPQSLPATALINNSMTKDPFPSILDIGGFKQIGGNRNIQEAITGNHTFTQQNTGKTLVHTGAAAATWNMPILLQGTSITIENEGGEITFNPQSSQTTRGGLKLPANSTGSVTWLIGGKIALEGTSL